MDIHFKGTLVTVGKPEAPILTEPKQTLSRTKPQPQLLYKLYNLQAFAYVVSGMYGDPRRPRQHLIRVLLALQCVSRSPSAKS